MTNTRTTKRDQMENFTSILKIKNVYMDND